MSKLKESKQEQDAKSSYQKAQERTLTRKLALARKRARETAKKQQAELQKVFEEDKLLPNKEPILRPLKNPLTGEDFLQYNVAEQEEATNDPSS